MTKKQREARKLIAPALESLVAAAVSAGAAMESTYGADTRAVRQRAKKQLHNTVKAFFYAYMAAEEVLK